MLKALALLAWDLALMVLAQARVAINIAARVNVNRPIVSEEFFEQKAHLQGQSPQFIGE